MTTEFDLDIEETDVDLGLESTETDETPKQDLDLTTDVKDPLAQSVYEQFLEKGYIDDSEEFDGTFEFIDNQISALPQKLLNSAIQQLPQESQQLLKFIATAGSDLTKKELKEFYQTYLAESDEIKFETQDEARAFLEADLRSKGFRDSAIRAQLDELEEEDTLLAEAEKIQKAKIKKTDQLLSNKIEEKANREKEQRIFISGIQQELEKTKWAAARQTKISQTIPKANEILQQIISKPKAYVQFIDLLTKFNGSEFDLEDFRKQGESRATKGIRDSIQKNGFSSAGTTNSSEEKMLDLLKNYEIVV